jgi:murein DD-endopeptidase MepM/ murein hydrolase activator NlpD
LPILKLSARKKLMGLGFLIVIIGGLLIPQKFSWPVAGADRHSYHPKSFWFYPWGSSGTHKGVDIFAKAGTPVHSTTDGLVVFAGEIEKGGKVVIIIGPKWRIHYYAHLQDLRTRTFSWRSRSAQLGTVGASGNAKGKSPHLHYSISTLIPYPWRIDSSRQGWKKMFYLNPIEYLNEI